MPLLLMIQVGMSGNRESVLRLEGDGRWVDGLGIESGEEGAITAMQMAAALTCRWQAAWLGSVAAEKLATTHESGNRGEGGAGKEHA